MKSSLIILSCNTHVINKIYVLLWRLTLPGNVIEDGREKADYHVDNGNGFYGYFLSVLLTQTKACTGAFHQLNCQAMSYDMKSFRPKCKTGHFVLKWAISIWSLSFYAFVKKLCNKELFSVNFASTGILKSDVSF